MTLQNQPTSKPTRKIQATAIGGAGAAILMGAINAYDPDLYGRLMQPGFEAGVAVFIALVAGYFARESL
jgi:hypothetical protein